MTEVLALEHHRFEVLGDDGKPNGIVVYLRAPTVLDRMRIYDAARSYEESPRATGSRVVTPRHFESALNLCVNHIVKVEGIRAPVEWPAAGTAGERVAWIDKYLKDREVYWIGDHVADLASLGEQEKNSSRG